MSVIKNMSEREKFVDGNTVSVHLVTFISKNPTHTTECVH